MLWQSWIFVVAVLVGTGMILCASSVWLRRQVFGFGGSMLTVFGVVLVGLSVWKHISVEVTAESTRFSFETLAQTQVALAKQVAQGSETALTAGPEPASGMPQWFGSSSVFSGLLVRTQQRPADSPEYWPMRIEFPGLPTVGATVRVTWDLGGTKRNDFTVQEVNASALKLEYHESGTTYGISLQAADRPGILVMTMFENSAPYNTEPANLFGQ